MNIPFSIKETDELFNNFSTGFLILNKDKECIYSNKYLLKLLNINQFDDNKARICEIFFEHIHEEDIKNELELKNSFFKYKQTTTSELRLYRDTSKSTCKWFKSARFILGDYYVLSLEDINDQKTLHLRIQEENNKIELLKQESANFLAQQSHSIRSPINGILGVITLLDSTTLSDEQSEYIEMLRECSYFLMTTVNDLLDFSKLEAGKMLLQKEEMNVRECIESVGNIIISKVYEKKIEYIFNINPDVPNIIFNDYNRLKQILLNLLYNSVKFTDAGNIYLNVSSINQYQYSQYINKYKKNPQQMSTTQSDDIFLKFDIIDTGCGIGSEDYIHLFKSYVQLKTDKLYQGTGLGLVISRELVELMDGCIWLDWSELNKGSRFSFIIRTKSSEKIEYIYNEDILKDKRVLVVDDNMYNRIAIDNMIRKWGMKSNTFSNGEEALISFRYNDYDICLIDICMPLMDGNSLSTKIKSIKNTPLIALSSIGEEYISSNFLSYILKPIKENQLKKICINTLSKLTNIDSKRPVKIQSSIKTTSILIAEDMYINRQVLTKFLKNIGYINIKESNNGQECLEEIYKKDYDIILLDIRMPVMDGVTTLENLNNYYESRKDQKKPYVIAVTAYGQDDKIKYLDMGFDDYIPKPIDIKQLENCLKKYS
jgi:signal transduction histidine kinase/CheY-like chemotaxis protein